MKLLRSLLLRASSVRALAEAWLVCAGLLAAALPVLIEATPFARSLYLVLLPALCAGFAVLRMRPFPGRAAAAVLKEALVALALTLGVMAVVFGLMALTSHFDLVQYGYGGVSWITLFFLSTAPVYLGARGALWLWQYWNGLRRRRYVWAMTHTILVIAGGTGVVVLIGLTVYLMEILKNDIWQIPAESAFAQAVFWLSMVLLLAFVLLAAGMALFLPPALLFSFLAARKMTARLEKLASVTQALRKGDLSTRVEVQGEDEVAQLQTDFNGMAADLEQSVRALQAEKDKVWSLMDARRELVADVSHELRNPTATILGYSDSLRRTWKDRSAKEIERDLEAIQYEAARLQTILNDLLAAAQLEAGRLRVTSQPVEAAALTRRLVETFSGLAWDSKRVQVTLSAPEVPLYALADPLRLEQVLVNLIQNALRHTSPGGLVVVEIHSEDDRVCIEVEDTGEGIAPEDLPHIWEKYYQSGSSQRSGSNGAGLGLSLVKELTEVMGGSVSVESCPEQGSLFQVRLPACASL